MLVAKKKKTTKKKTSATPKKAVKRKKKTAKRVGPAKKKPSQTGDIAKEMVEEVAGKVRAAKAARVAKAGSNHYTSLRAPALTVPEVDRELKSFVGDTAKRPSFKPFNKKLVKRMIHIAVVEQAADLIDPAGDTERLARRVRRSYREAYGSAMLSGLLVSIIVGIISNLIAKWLRNWWDNRQKQYCLSDDLCISEQTKLAEAMGRAAKRWVAKDAKNAAGG